MASHCPRRVRPADTGPSAAQISLGIWKLLGNCTDRRHVTIWGPPENERSFTTTTTTRRRAVGPPQASQFECDVDVYSHKRTMPSV